MATWKTIPHHPKYEVSDDGRVRRGERELKQHQRAGYRRVVLCQGGAPEIFLVHRLVLEAFVGPAPEGYWCCHRDGVKWHNRLSNLRWDTPRANKMEYVQTGGGRGERHPSAKLTVEAVRAIRLALLAGERVGALARRYGVSQTTLSDIKSGKTWRYV